jgi:DNA-binding response OmpR family regulator
MRREEYSNASILHYDTRQRVGKRTCTALRELGFRRITNVNNANELGKLMRAKQFDLTVYGSDAADSASLDFICRTRQYGKSSDPFTPMILMTWNAAVDVVRSALNTGTDQLLLWPFSAQQLGVRVDALVSARKRFIETEDYMGPERRDTSGRRVRSHSIEVPNALRAKVERRPDLAPSAEAIQVARTNLEFVKISNIARRICAIAKLLGRNGDDAGSSRHRPVGDLDTILKSLAVVRHALAAGGQEHRLSFCDSVEQVAVQLNQAAPAFDGKGLALLEQTAMALRVAVDMDQKPDN